MSSGKKRSRRSNSMLGSLSGSFEQSVGQDTDHKLGPAAGSGTVINKKVTHGKWSKKTYHRFAPDTLKFYLSSDSKRRKTQESAASKGEELHIPAFMSRMAACVSGRKDVLSDVRKIIHERSRCIRQEEDENLVTDLVDSCTFRYRTKEDNSVALARVLNPGAALHETDSKLLKRLVTRRALKKTTPHTCRKNSSHMASRSRFWRGCSCYSCFRSVDDALYPMLVCNSCGMPCHQASTQNVHETCRIHACTKHTHHMRSIVTQHNIKYTVLLKYTHISTLILRAFLSLVPFFLKCFFFVFIV